MGELMARPIMDAVEKFWRNVLPEPNSGCWLWIGVLNRQGYGVHGYGGRGGKIVRAHRFSYQLHKGAIPDLGEKGWSDRTVKQHISDWRRGVRRAER